MLAALFQTRDRFLFLLIWCMPAWCTRKSLGKYYFRSILGYFLSQWNWGDGTWGKKKAEHLISVYFTVEGKEGAAAAAIIPESHFRLAFCCQNHSFTTVRHSHMVPSTSGPQRNLQTVTITTYEYRQLLLQVLVWGSSKENMTSSWIRKAQFSTYRLWSNFQDDGKTNLEEILSFYPWWMEVTFLFPDKFSILKVTGRKNPPLRNAHGPLLSPKLSLAKSSVFFSNC